MSEHAEIRFRERENISILLGKKEIGESSYHHNSLWMAHWTSRMRNEGGPISHTENTKTRVAEQLVIGMNRRTTTSANLLSKSENFDFYFKSLTQKSMVSSNMEACEILEGSDHFPMYGFKKKIESILNPKGKARFENRTGLNLTFHSSEFHFETQVEDAKNHKLTALESCSCSEEGNMSTSSQVKCPSDANGTQSMDSADSLRGCRKRKASSLFEMVSLPTEPYDMAQRRRISKSCENLKWPRMIDNFGKSEEQDEESDAVPVDNMKVFESVEDTASSREQKVMASCNLTKLNSTATESPGKSATRDALVGSLNTNLDPGPSRTMTMNAAESVPKSSVIRTVDSNSMEKQQKPSDQDAHGNRWLKRLKRDISSNSFILSPNNPKLQSKDPSQAPEQQVKCWMQRWRVKKVSSEEGESFGVVKAELQEKQFPSIHAMAMMGKAMNKIKPCEFERRGPSLVWNNNEF